MRRDKLNRAALDTALAMVARGVENRLRRHGDDALAGRHEVYGMMAEEFAEALEALRRDSNPMAFGRECIDVAVAAVVGVASIGEVKASVNMTPGRIAYEAYREQLGGAVMLRNEPDEALLEFVEWDAVDQHLQTAWEVAASAARVAL